MTITNRIKELCDYKGITIAALERTLDFGNGTIRRWCNTSPSIDKLKLVADYFGVKVGYLIGDDQDHRDIAKELEGIMLYLESNENSLLFYGHPMDKIDTALLQSTLKNTLDIIKIKKEGHS